MHLPPFTTRAQLTTSGDKIWLLHLVGARGICWTESRDAAPNPTVHKTASMAEIDLTSNANSSKIEKIPHQEEVAASWGSKTIETTVGNSIPVPIM